MQKDFFKVLQNWAKNIVVERIWEYGTKYRVIKKVLNSCIKVYEL